MARQCLLLDFGMELSVAGDAVRRFWQFQLWCNRDSFRYSKQRSDVGWRPCKEHQLLVKGAEQSVLKSTLHKFAAKDEYDRSGHPVCSKWMHQLDRGMHHWPTMSLSKQSVLLSARASLS